MRPQPLGRLSLNLENKLVLRWAILFQAMMPNPSHPTAGTSRDQESSTTSTTANTTIARWMTSTSSRSKEYIVVLRTLVRHKSEH